MNREDIKTKIKKLLTLAERGNENEARVAMAKAQMLMAQYKIKASDCKEQSEVIMKDLSLYFTDYKNNYIAFLVKNLSEFYCCTACETHAKGSKKRFIRLIGFADDVNVFENVLLFACSCVDEWYKSYKRKYGHMYTNEYLNAIKNQYGRGFVAGLKNLIEDQARQIEQEWGLVMAAPREAHEYIEKLKPMRGNFNCAVYDRELYETGYRDGYRAEINDKLNEKKYV